MSDEVRRNAPLCGAVVRNRSCAILTPSVVWTDQTGPQLPEGPGNYPLPYVTQYSFRAGNRASGPDVGRIPIGRASKSVGREARFLARKLDFWPGSAIA